MELKNITELETQYPTDQQTDKKKLKKNIPAKWTKLGLTAFIFNLMMSKKALAEIDPNNIIKYGNKLPKWTYHKPSITKEEILICASILLILILLFILIFLVVIRKKKELKK